MKEDPLAEMLRPPDSMLAKLSYYSRRYGTLHTICSYIGRHWLGFWCIVGPLVTRPYLRRWLRSRGPHVLNLGGGNVLFDRWLSGDMDPRSDVFMNVCQPLPLPDNSVDVVYSEEVIEHVPKTLGQSMLRECFRILKPGGTLRLTTPDLAYFAKRALEVKEAVSEINDIFYLHGHKHIYSRTELVDCLAAAGFADITVSSYRDPASRYGKFDTHPARVAYAPAEWSQFWEAEKPAGRSTN
jgi:predicted SAM-dependent methyltransferase